MAYCWNCGVQLADDAKFCHECGAATKIESAGYMQRRQEYAGKIFKCPNCGEPVKSFDLNCPVCGFELRDVKASSAVKEFARELNKIESNGKSMPGILEVCFSMFWVSEIDKEKISLIKNFAVPNSKEDMLEFMILAVSNINTDAYKTAYGSVYMREMRLNAAWLSKAKQVYEKARNSYATDGVFIEIKDLYDKCNAEIKKIRIKWIVKLNALWIVPLLLLTVMFSCGKSGSNKSEAKEIARLESIVVDVEEALEKQEYKHALMIAESIEYHRYEKDEKQKWSIEREYWIDKVLEEAEKNGVELEYAPDTENSETNNQNESENNDEKTGEAGK